MNKAQVSRIMQLQARKGNNNSCQSSLLFSTTCTSVRDWSSTEAACKSISCHKKASFVHNLWCGFRSTLRHEGQSKKGLKVRFVHRFVVTKLFHVRNATFQ